MRIFLFICLLTAFTIEGLSQSKGYGFVFEIQNDSFRVTNVFPNSPAELAGVAKGDWLTSIDSEATYKMTLEKAASLLAASQAVRLYLHRNGEDFHVDIPKALTTTYDRKCISGDCVNGVGKALFYASHLIYEATFINGIPTGAVKSYYEHNGKPHFGGNFNSSGQPDSKGIFYHPDGDKDREGQFNDGELTEGTVYTGKNIILTQGKYRDGKLVSGLRRSNYRGRVAYYEGGEYLNASNQPSLNGTFTIYEETPAHTKGRILSKGMYSQSQRSGMHEEYEYDNDAKFVMQFRSGDVWNGEASIYRISDGKKIGEHVVFVKNVSDFGQQILMGDFDFSDLRYSVGTMSKPSSLASIKEQYFNSYAQSKQAIESLTRTTNPSPSNGNSGSSYEALNASLDKNVAKVVSLDKEYQLLIRQKGKEKATHEMRQKIAGLCTLIVANITDLLDHHRSRFTQKEIDEMIAHRDFFRDKRDEMEEDEDE